MIILLPKKKTTKIAAVEEVAEADVVAEVAEKEKGKKVRTDPALKDVATVEVIAVAEVAETENVVDAAEEEVAAARDALAKKVMNAPEEKAAEEAEDVVP